LIYFAYFVEKAFAPRRLRRRRAAQGGANIGVFDVFDQNYLIRRAFFYFKDQ